MKLKTIIKNQPNLFWAFHLGGWALWGIFGKYLYTATVLDEVAPGYAAYVAVITVIGMIIAFQSIEAAGGVNPVLVWGGIKVSMLTSAFGTLILAFSALLWFALQMRWRILQAKEARDD